MLTLILLVVLGGGAGLMAVWLIDARGLSGLLGPLGGRSLRRIRRGGTTRSPSTPAVEGRHERRFEPLAPSAPEPAADVSPAGPVAAVAYEPVEVLLEPVPAATARRDGKRIPAAYTAVEGSYRDVARAPLWRKLLSLVSLLGILVLIGVTIAALAGATFGAVAELLDGAIG